MRSGVGEPSCVGEARERPCEEHAERGMHVRARHEVAAGAHRRIGVEPARPVQCELHERRERDGALGADARSDRGGRIASHGRSMASTCEDERRGRATHPSRRVGGLCARRRQRRARGARRATQLGEPLPARLRRVPRRGGRCRRRGARGAMVRRSGARPASRGRARARRGGRHHPHRRRARRIRWVRAHRRRAAVARTAVGAVPLGGSARRAGSLRCPLLHGGGRRRRRRPRPTAPR